jgi:hypothetical protein
MLHVMRVQDDRQLLEGPDNIKPFRFFATGHSNKPFIFDQLQKMVEVIFIDGFLVSYLGMDGDKFGKIRATVLLVFFNL